MEIKLHDIVQTRSGQQIVVTGFNPTRPANKYKGVLASGTGKEYIFGDKHVGTIIGKASEAHPALKALNSRKEQQKHGDVDGYGHAPFCEQTAKYDTNHADAWRLLANTPIGGQIRLLVRGKPKFATLKSILFRGQRYHFAAQLESGGSYKFSVAAIITPANK